MFKRNLAVLGLSALLSACGFHLRGLEATDFALQEIDLEARDSYSAITRQLEDVLENNGVNVTNKAPFTLELLKEEVRERAVSYTSAARSAEFELTSVLNYQVLGRNDRVLLADSLEVQKIYVRDSNNVVGSEREAAQLRDEMQRDLVQLLVQRLRRITPAELERLQATAEARAQAEAEALRLQRDAEPDPSPLQSWPQ